MKYLGVFIFLMIALKGEILNLKKFIDYLLF
jgi:hypothetical protein